MGKKPPQYSSRVGSPCSTPTKQRNKSENKKCKKVTVHKAVKTGTCSFYFQVNIFHIIRSENEMAKNMLKPVYSYFLTYIIFCFFYMTFPCRIVKIKNWQFRHFRAGSLGKLPLVRLHRLSQALYIFFL